MQPKLPRFLGRIGLSVLLVIAAAGTAAEKPADMVFDPRVLAERIMALPLGPLEGLEAPYGPPTSPAHETVTYSDPELGAVEVVAFPLRRDGTWNSLVFRIHASEEAARRGLDKAFAIPEARQDDGTYSFRLGTVGVFSPEVPDGFEMTCATRLRDEPFKVTQVHCAYPASDGQVVIVVESHGWDLQSEDDYHGTGLSLYPPIVRALRLLGRVEGQLLATGEGLRPRSDLARPDAPVPAPESVAEIVARLNQHLKGQEYTAVLLDDREVAHPTTLIIDRVVITQKTLELHNDANITRFDVATLGAADVGNAQGVSMVLIDAHAVVSLPVSGRDELVELPTARPVMVDCADACNAVADDLRSLIALMNAPGFVAPGPTTAAPEIAGIWELYVPTPQGSFARWMLELGGDGHYTFTDTSSGASHQGTYRADNGKWSLDGAWTQGAGVAPGSHITFADQGTYRLLSIDAMEFVGRFGPAVWKKVGAS